MKVLLLVRRKEMTLYLDMEEDTRIADLKKTIEEIINTPVENQRLFSKKGKEMLDYMRLMDFGFCGSVDYVLHPYEVGLVLKQHNDFEPLNICTYSAPTDLPQILTTASNIVDARITQDKRSENRAASLDRELSEQAPPSV